MITVIEYKELNDVRIDKALTYQFDDVDSAYDYIMDKIEEKENEFCSYENEGLVRKLKTRSFALQDLPEEHLRNRSMAYFECFVNLEEAYGFFEYGFIVYEEVK